LVLRIVDLPTLPTVIPQVLRIVENRRSSAGDLARVIGADQSLASRILRLANSAFYGFRREITSISHAVVLLGYDTVKSMVLAATVFDTLRDGDSGKTFDRQGFWLHAVATATAARTVARGLRLVDPDQAFVGGLLHDIGKVVLDRYFFRRYAEAAKLAGELPCLIREAEEIIFGVDHAEVGRWLAERWRLPRAIVEPIAFHHLPSAGAPEHWGLSATIHLADVVARNAGIGSGGDELIPLPEEAVLVRFRIRSGHLLAWTQALETEREAVETFFREVC
jgi:putative nucleotidyltransferase with HDIG domain